MLVFHVMDNKEFNKSQRYIHIYIYCRYIVGYIYIHTILYLKWSEHGDLPARYGNFIAENDD